MNTILKACYFIVSLFCLWNGDRVYSQNGPEALFLSWSDDPTSTMVINWHTLDEMENDSLYFRLVGECQWNVVRSKQKGFPFSDHIIYRVNLENLASNSDYEFRIGRAEKIFWFETMPVDINEEPVVFAIGGDTYDRDLDAPRHMWMERMNRTVMEYNPDFIVWGGDLAYADGRKDQIWRWYGWLKAVKNTLIREDGKVVPIVVAIGNHEVNTNYFEWGSDYEANDIQRQKSAPYFYSIFDFPGQPGYNVLDFANYLSLIILDSDHTNPVSGLQTRWLEKVLSERKDVAHVFPVYHVPAYPSTKSDLNQRTSQRVREYWTPLFDDFNLSLAFEHHDHAYKRTPPIQNEKLDSSGTIYLGDGGWGTKVREPKDVDTTWYLEKTVRVRYALLVSLYRDQWHLLAIDEYGRTIDEYPKLFDRPTDKVRTNAVLMPNGGMSISAEYGHPKGQVYFDSYFDGYTGGGYAWFINDGGSEGLKWTIPVEKPGEYYVRFRYSNPGKRVLTKLQVNGESIQYKTALNTTESVSDWTLSEMIEVDFHEGKNVLELNCHDEAEFYVDKIEVFPK